ncbi:hypothetical protein AB0M47_23735 [Hamadaea sp. NPDC051192]|uniref:hypothetical protein n=1 Tax=Hamadaea sp. NPDC051192 TaxID=3154940 RepID=UPI00342F9754
MSHEVTIGDLRASRWNVPDFDTVWRGLNPAQVDRFIREIHADVAQAISAYETALAVADEERQRLESEVLRLRGPSVAAADYAESTGVAVEPAAVDPTAEAEPGTPEAEPAAPPVRGRRAKTAVATA